jgi:polyisoprenoid-binding protein YceI
MPFLDNHASHSHKFEVRTDVKQIRTAEAVVAADLRTEQLNDQDIRPIQAATSAVRRYKKTGEDTAGWEVLSLCSSEL